MIHYSITVPTNMLAPGKKTTRRISTSGHHITFSNYPNHTRPTTRRQNTTQQDRNTTTSKHRDHHLTKYINQNVHITIQNLNISTPTLSIEQQYYIFLVLLGSADNRVYCY